MKYILERSTFVKNLKINEKFEIEGLEMINEEAPIEADIAFGDSYIGRMFASIFRMAQMGWDLKRVDSLINRLKLVAEKSIVYSTVDAETKKEIDDVVDESDNSAIYDSIIASLLKLKEQIKSKKYDNKTIVDMYKNIIGDIKDNFGDNSIEVAINKIEQEDVKNDVESIVNSAEKLSLPEPKETSKEISKVGASDNIVNVDKIQKIFDKVKSIMEILEKDPKNSGSSIQELESWSNKLEENLKVLENSINKLDGDKKTSAQNLIKNIKDVLAKVNQIKSKSSNKNVMESINGIFDLIFKINEDLKQLGSGETEKGLSVVNKNTSLVKTDNKESSKNSEDTDQKVEDVKSEDVTGDNIKIDENEIEIDDLISKLRDLSNKQKSTLKQAVDKIKDSTDKMINGKLDKVAFDPIEVLRIFNDANRIFVRQQIPSVRTGGKVSVARKNNWEPIGKGDGDSGPFRNIKLFSKWNDGVLELMKDKKLEPFFNSKIVKVDGEEKEVKYSVTAFINDMLNDNKAFNEGGYQKKYLDEHFGIKDFSSTSTKDNNTALNEYIESKELDYYGKYYSNQSFRLTLASADGKEKDYYFVGYNNEGMNELDEFNKKLCYFSKDNDTFIKNVFPEYQSNSSKNSEIYFGLITFGSKPVKVGTEVTLKYFKVDKVSELKDDQLPKATEEKLKVEGIYKLVDKDKKSVKAPKKGDNYFKYNGHTPYTVGGPSIKNIKKILGL